MLNKKKGYKILIGNIFIKKNFFNISNIIIMLEPCAVKIASTVLRGGKLELAYLSQPQIAAIM